MICHTCSRHYGAYRTPEQIPVEMFSPPSTQDAENTNIILRVTKYPVSPVLSCRRLLAPVRENTTEPRGAVRLSCGSALPGLERRRRKTPGGAPGAPQDRRRRVGGRHRARRRRRRCPCRAGERGRWGRGRGGAGGGAGLPWCPRRRRSRRRSALTASRRSGCGRRCLSATGEKTRVCTSLVKYIHCMADLG